MESKPGQPPAERFPRRALTPQEIAARLNNPQGSTPDVTRSAAPIVANRTPSLQPLAEGRIPPAYSAPIAATNPTLIDQPDASAESRPGGENSLVMPRLSIAWKIVAGTALLLALILFIPWKPVFPDGDLDSSWQMVLHWAFAHGVDFGHNLVFTYGPLGFIWGGYDPATFNWQIAGWSLFTLAFVAGVLRICRALTDAWPVAAAGLLAVILLTVSGPTPQDVRIFSLCWILTIIHFFVDDRPLTLTKILLTLAVALVTLVKFSAGLLALVSIACISFDEIRRRRIPWLGLIYLGAIAILWMLAGQPVDGFIPWLRHSWMVAGHFASAESGDMESQVRDVLLFLGCAALFLTVVAIAQIRRHGLRKMFSIHGLLALAAICAALLVIFKNGYVRHDGHETMATNSLMLLSLLFVGAVWRGTNSRVARGVMIVLLAASVGLAHFSDSRLTDKGLPRYLLSTIQAFPFSAHAAFAWAVGHSTAENDYREFKQTIRDQTPLPQINGTVDVYTWAQRLALANDLQFNPRPVIQSYTAFTPELEELDARFLRGPHAPDSILFDLKTLDYRYAAGDDAFSWPELLTRYELVDATSRLLLLRRRPDPVSYTIAPLSTVSASIGQWVDVPQTDEPIWVKFDIKTRWLGSARNFLYKPPVTYLEIKTLGNEVERQRLVTEIANGGFLLSPHIPDRMTFAMFQSPDWKQLLRTNLVTQLRVVTETGTNGEPWFASDDAITFSELRFKHADVSRVPGADHYMRMLQVANTMRYRFTNTKPQFMGTKDGDFVIIAPATSVLVFPAPRDATSLKLQYAMIEDSYLGTSKSDPVDFIVAASTETDLSALKGPQLFSNKLDPAITPSDRGLQNTGDLPLPRGTTYIILETLPGPSGQPSQPVWSDIVFK